MTDHRDEHRRVLRDTMMKLTAQSTAKTEAHLQHQLRVVTRAAVDMIRGAELADVMLVDGDRFTSVAATHPLVADLDAVQMQHGAGPCLDVAEDGPVIHVRDFSLETRWPEFTAAALAAGVRSALTFRLYTHQRGIGALNVFSGAAGAFTRDDAAVGAMLATHAAIVLIAAADEGVDPTSDLVADDLIGQAKGILMERFVIDSAAAFDLMLERAETEGTSMHAVATAVVASI
ncbi:GAF and ANTAR domain-containing protein [Mycobacterium yunnanensis]|uniref:GAF and ANTAR domain-containing protein n=1 Tax=Mycobacterium yunnanensis TaxID=368477 RepID=A0A9X2Z0J4_9MYCO|nr:GAF and ANTAR domain-containing protein [Mycobacterium yunnanensis]MCV7420714.1 GAF and ANTAR domain-containing protein [Mycobacterium yunnanensis]